MPILLEEALSHPTLAAADPIVRAAAGMADTTQLRWIHSSEVLDIAPLLAGGELLLTGGESLAMASDDRRTTYVRELAARGVAALAVETGNALPSLPSSMVAAAEEAGLPLIELRRVVPFVGVMQAINSMLVSESVSQLQRADEASHAMAVELSHGGSLDGILSVLAGITGADVTLTSTGGVMLASAASERAEANDAGNFQAEEKRGRAILIDVPVRGIPSAQLALHVPAGADANLARVAGKRSVDILALALQQKMPPGLKEVAGAALLRAIDSGSQGWRLHQLAGAAGISASATVVAFVVHSARPQQLRGAVEQLLARTGQQGATYVDNAELLAIAVFDGGSTSGGFTNGGSTNGASTNAGRSVLLKGLLALDLAADTVVGVGPLAPGIAQAPWSLSEARLTLELQDSRGPGKGGAFGSGSTVLDAEDFAVERLATHSVDSTLRGDYVRQQLGALLDHDSHRQSQLLSTLTTWMDAGCNTAQAARELHLERQSMHQRLQRIFELCGGDPRGTGRLAGLHLAARLARM